MAILFTPFSFFFFYFFGAALNNDEDITGVQIESIAFLLSRYEILAT
jgi:hypothetical protein